MRQSGKGKGVKRNLTPEGRESLSNAVRTRMKNLTPEQRWKYGSSFRGKPSHRRGKQLPTVHCLNIARGLRKSEIFKDRVKQYHESKVEDFLRRLYDIPQDVVFYPASKREHRFARTVLIEERVSFGFITCSGLRERKEWEQNDEGESENSYISETAKKH